MAYSHNAIKTTKFLALNVRQCALFSNLLNKKEIKNRWLFLQRYLVPKYNVQDSLKAV